MNDKKKRIYLLSQEGVSKALFKLGIPTMIGMMTSALYNLVDTFFVAKLGTAQVAAVSVVFPLSLIVLGIGLLFGSGAASYLARLLGDNKLGEADRCASTTIFTSSIIGLILNVILLIALNPVLRILGATDTILPYARSYAVLFIIGLIFNIFNITMNNIITSEGATLYSMMAMLIGGAVNMILDPLLIYSAGLGIRGAALATLLSRCVSAMIFFYYALSGKSRYHFSIRNIVPDKKMYGEVIKIGVPMLMYQLLTSVSLSITNLFAASYGDYAVAALGVVSRIISLGAMMIFGFLKGYQPFVGYNFGAGNRDRVKTATRTVMIWTTVFCCLFAGVLITFSTPVMQIFAKENRMVIELGRRILILNGITFLGLGFQAVYSSYFLAIGRAKEGGMISIGRQGMFFIPLIFLLTLSLHMQGLILAQPLADLLSIIMVLILKNKYEKSHTFTEQFMEG